MNMEFQEKCDMLIKEIFHDCCQHIREEDHDKIEYEFCEMTIINTLNYFKRKRNEKTN